MWTLPFNEHPLPIAEAFDGFRWTVDLSYRHADLDVESTSTHQDLDRARQHAFTNLKRLIAQ